MVEVVERERVGVFYRSNRSEGSEEEEKRYELEVKLRNSVCNHLSSHFNIATMSSAEGNNLVIVVFNVINTFCSSLTSEYIYCEKLGFPVEMSVRESRADALQYTQIYVRAFNALIIL
jgi:hypothetical protein